MQRRQSRKLDKVTKDITEKIYSKPIQNYQCDFNIDDPNGTYQSATQKVDVWVRDVVEEFQRPNTIITDSTIDNTRIIEIEDPQEGSLKIEVYSARDANLGEFGVIPTVLVQVNSANPALIDKIMKHGQPYYSVSWYTAEPIDVPQLMKKIEEMTEKTPGSKGGFGTNDGETTWDSVDYGFVKLEQGNVRFSFSTNRIYIVLDRKSPNIGFYSAHKKLNPGKLVAMILGEVKIQDARKIIKECMKL
ncbi:hypothetical protein [Candidatus Nitrosotenuis chungbukensis]|uniref:hypothetical protein n=2 Tax=Candidatus Nitrosotenuis chungbukensis TaxID=1353246 RepID=UPI0012FE97E1|nr:hypothetical protein [Candidatus Nitrosotenuis chungbukensis]